jgi:hypothetical protein
MESEDIRQTSAAGLRQANNKGKGFVFSLFPKEIQKIEFKYQFEFNQTRIMQ